MLWLRSSVARPTPLGTSLSDLSINAWMPADYLDGGRVNEAEAADSQSAGSAEVRASEVPDRG